MPVCQYLGWDILEKASKYQQHLGFLQMDSSPDRHPNSFAVFGHRAGTFQPCVLGRSLRGLFFDFFPTCQVRVTRFYQSDAWGGHPHPHPHPPPPPRTPRASVSPAADRSGNCRTASASSRSQWALRDFICQLQIAVGTAGPQLQAADCSGQRRTSTASSRSQWALPDLMCELQIPVGNAGPQPRAPDPSGQRRTSTASSRSQWATPDLNGELPIPVGNAGPQLRGPHPSGQRRTSTASSDRISDRMPDRMSDRMSERMAERYAR